MRGLTLLDGLKAVGVAVLVMVITVVASFPMVAVYRYLIEPGHETQFYLDSALWIAPLSSYVLGPLAFFAFNYGLARRRPARCALCFAVAGFVAYVLIDCATIPLFGADPAAFFTADLALSLSVKLLGAVAGAYIAKRVRPSAKARRA